MAKLIEEVERTSRVVIRRRYPATINVYAQLAFDVNGKAGLQYTAHVTVSEIEYDKETRAIIGQPVVVGVFSMPHEELMLKGVVPDINSIGRAAQERYDSGDRDFGPPPG